MTNRLLTAFAVCVFLSIFTSTAAAQQQEVVEYYALDAVGSVRVVFDQAGAITTRRDYEPFGGEVTPVTSDPKVYAGLFRDDESKLDYAQARMYQSRTGRFASVDPVYSGLLNPQTWNRYGYAANSPLVFVDPEGLQFKSGTKGCVEGFVGMTRQDYREGCSTGGASVALSSSIPTLGLSFNFFLTAPESNRTGRGPRGNRNGPITLGVQWVTGIGDRNQVFTDGDPLTEQLKESAHIEEVRRKLAQTCASGQFSMSNNLSGFAGVPKYLRDYSTLLTGGMTGNLAATYLGSYTLTANVANASGGSLTVDFNVRNRSSVASAIRPPVLGYTRVWQTYFDATINDAFSGDGPFSTTTQTITWSEAVPCSGS